MRTVRTFKELAKELDQLQKPVGFVPTMGYLHEGHLSLVRRAKEENQAIVVSIFANPTQFAPDEDLSNYPRDIEGDLKMLKKEKTDLVWIPDAGDIYPDNFQTWVNVEDLTEKLEGIYRPDHFRGVTTVVAKLFNAIQPDKAYFGQKDAQQVIVIQQMTKDLNYPIEIVVCPTVREPDGLAMSSRNSYLNEKERRAALSPSAMRAPHRPLRLRTAPGGPARLDLVWRRHTPRMSRHTLGRMPSGVEQREF